MCGDFNPYMALIMEERRKINFRVVSSKAELP